MAERQWYIAIGDKPQGPFSDERLRGLIGAGSVRADTLVWCDGMSNWARAGDIPGLMSGARRPPTLPTAGNDTGPLAANIPLWPYFGRALLVILGFILVVPTPWVMTSFYRWFVEKIELPSGQRATFTGKPGDIWYIFMLYALCAGYAGFVGYGVGLLTLPLIVLFVVIIARWFCRNLAWEGQSAALRFTGGYWPMLGWYVLSILAVFTIIGGAWVATAWTRWMCRHLEGSGRKVIFNASGWGLLWRTFLLVLFCILLVPIPWAIRWFTLWLVSQFALARETAPGAVAA